MKMPKEVYSTICVILTVLTGFMLLIKISRPFNLLRGILLPTLVAVFAGCCLVFKDWFTVVLPKEYIEVTIVLSGMTIFNFVISNMISNKILCKIRRKLKVNRKAN